MSITQTPGTSASEAAIFSRVFAEGRRSLTPDLARHILTLEFSDDDKARMHDLAVKNQEGCISLKNFGIWTVTSKSPTWWPSSNRKPASSCESNPSDGMPHG
jgi:hypothetical protein